jgi:hypothetical protein
VAHWLGQRRGVGKAPISWSSKHASKVRVYGFRRHNVNPMLVLRNAVCNRQWKHTWETALAHRQGLRTQCRQAQSQQRLENACWFLAVWGVRVYRLSHPSAAAPTLTTQTFQKHPTARPGSGYSWHKPFLRRLPSTPRATVEVGAKK